VGLYSNIALKMGIYYFEEALNKRKDQTVPTTLLITILSLVLKLNIFEFGTLQFQQLIGSAMGTPIAPNFANIFMAMIDKKLLQNGNKFVHFFKRFIDDILIIWTGTEQEFLTFMNKINCLHDTIKFTHSYHIETRSTTFVDMTVSIINDKIVTNL
jgi:hypothetical protein